MRAAAGDLRSGLLGIGANDRVPAARVGEMVTRLMEAEAAWTPAARAR
ncbi:MAG: hypothetical protein R3D61_15315 [Defluviimonas denitrificans]